MGYRSEVACLIYGKPENMAALVMKQRHTASFDIFAKGGDAFGEHIEEWEDDGVAYLKMYGADWKWYSNYPSVDTWTQFMLSAPSFNLAYEFVRIGEEDSDVEVDRCDGNPGGEGVEVQEIEYLLSVSRCALFDIAPPDRPGLT